VECGIQTCFGKKTNHKPDGSKTTNTLETLEYIAEYLILEDNLHDDMDYHKNFR